MSLAICRFIREAANQRHVGGQNFEAAKLGGRDEAQLGDLDGARLADERRDVHEHVEIELGVGVEHDFLDLADARAAAELLAELAHQRVDGRLAGLDLSAGKFPQQRHRLIGASLRQKDAPLGVPAERGHDELSRARRGRHERSFRVTFRVVMAASYLDAIGTAAYGSRPRSQPVKLYTGKIAVIAEEMIRTLTTEGDIEVGDGHEAQLDVEAILKEYVRVDRELTDKAKDVMEQRSLPYGQFGKLKRAMAEEKQFALGEEATAWMANQILESFMASAHVEEVFADDVVLRKKVRDILRKHMMVDEELDQEVRNRIKNLEEGTQAWELEYKRAMEQIKRKHGLE
jgi:hypothetical protein